MSTVIAFEELEREVVRKYGEDYEKKIYNYGNIEFKKDVLKFLVENVDVSFIYNENDYVYEPTYKYGSNYTDGPSSYTLSGTSLYGRIRECAFNAWEMKNAVVTNHGRGRYHFFSFKGILLEIDLIYNAKFSYVLRAQNSEIAKIKKIFNPKPYGLSDIDKIFNLRGEDWSSFVANDCLQKIVNFYNGTLCDFEVSVYKNTARIKIDNFDLSFFPRVGRFKTRSVWQNLENFYQSVTLLYDFIDAIISHHLEKNISKKDYAHYTFTNSHKID